MDFVEKLSSFSIVAGFEKFDINNRDLKFEDGKVMSLWFIRNKNNIFLLENSFSKRIKEQYENYTHLKRYVDQEVKIKRAI